MAFRGFFLVGEQICRDGWDCGYSDCPYFHPDGRAVDYYLSSTIVVPPPSMLDVAAPVFVPAPSLDVTAPVFVPTEEAIPDVVPTKEITPDISDTAILTLENKRQFVDYLYRKYVDKKRAPLSYREFDHPLHGLIPDYKSSRIQLLAWAVDQRLITIEKKTLIHVNEENIITFITENSMTTVSLVAEDLKIAELQRKQFVSLLQKKCFEEKNKVIKLSLLGLLLRPILSNFEKGITMKLTEWAQDEGLVITEGKGGNFSIIIQEEKLEGYMAQHTPDDVSDRLPIVPVRRSVPFSYSQIKATPGAPVSLSAIVDRLQDVKNETVIFLDADTLLSQSHIQFFLKHSYTGIELDFLIVAFVGNEFNLAHFGELAKSSFFCYTKAITAHKDNAADINLSMLASIANKFILAPKNPIYIISQDRFRLKCIAFLKKMQTRDIKDITLDELFGLIKSKKNPAISQLEPAETKPQQIGQCLSVKFDETPTLENKQSQFIETLYRYCLNQETSTVFASAVYYLVYGVTVCTEMDMPQLCQWAINEGLIILSGGIRSLQITICEEKIKKFLSARQSAPVMSGRVFPLTLIETEERLKQIVNGEAVIFIDPFICPELVQILLDCDLLSYQLGTKFNFSIFTFFDGRIKRTSLQSFSLAAQYSCFSYTQPLRGDLLEFDFAMIAAIANKLLPLNSPIYFFSTRSIFHECIEHLKQVNPERQKIELITNIAAFHKLTTDTFPHLIQTTPEQTTTMAPRSQM